MLISQNVNDARHLSDEDIVTDPREKRKSAQALRRTHPSFGLAMPPTVGLATVVVANLPTTSLKSYSHDLVLKFPHCVGRFLAVRMSTQ
jgi:hypothetical protein